MCLTFDANVGRPLNVSLDSRDLEPSSINLNGQPGTLPADSPAADYENDCCLQNKVLDTAILKYGECFKSSILEANKEILNKYRFER